MSKNPEYLYVYKNFLTGNIPDEFSNLNSLTRFRLGDNLFTFGAAGGAETYPFPTAVFNIPNLEELNIERSLIGGELPPTIGNLKSLLKLHVNDNEIEGFLPTEIGAMERLEELTVDDNNLKGPIPTEIGNLINLNLLKMHRNMFDGAIPTEFGNLKLLEELSLYGNQLTSISSELGGMSKMRIFDAGANRISGPIPPNFERMGWDGNNDNLEVLVLDQNQLTGNIPTEFGFCVELKTLRLNENRLNGKIPTSLGDMIKIGKH